MDSYLYSIVRYVPDPVRGEQVNIGVVVAAEGSSPTASSAAWVVGRGRFVAGEREQSMRYSGVARREGDRWVIVHSHASIGVPNEDLFN